ncbi:leukocyte surface antigen CD47 isoform X4 [Crotalus tigris]|uniref:leukocyte surface antigen CD47 isoform X4 n=1 Tax=Crotalus tigris TaxID=88082 RepID=UPI00192F3514|nr:leukocyte surface antigen CD47 isoform X4 [Crotalus tigris]XP_039220938.1 leukocyte surface antigen CD47 isoform X4 [Crotalus tigris]
MLCVWAVLLGTLGAGSAQLVLHSIPFLEIKYYNGPEIILPCLVTNLKENSRLSMLVEWQFQGNKFFFYDGVTDSVTKNNSFDTATFLNRSMVPYGIASLVISTKQALLGNYTCAVTELNREGRTTFELRESSGSAQLVLDSIPFLEIKHCNGGEIILPCVVTNLKEHSSLSMFVKWHFQGNQFFLYDGVTDNITKNNSFDTATFLNRSMVPYGIVSLVISTKQAPLGNYTCEVTEVNREGRTKFELRESSACPSECVPWFQPVERFSIISIIILIVILYWCQFITVAIKFDMEFEKKIGLSFTGLLITIFAVTGTILFAHGGYIASVKAGIGIIVIPVIIVVPLLYFLFTSVFEKQPLFAVILLALKALGYVIAVAGFALCVTACQPKHGSVLIAGLAIIGAVGAIGLIYIIIIGSNLKDHHPPRHWM